MAANPAHVRRSATSATDTKRPFFRLKSDWAEWEAAQVEDAIRQMEQTHIPSYKWAQVQQKVRVLGSMRDRAAQWRARARAYRAQGN